MSASRGGCHLMSTHKKKRHLMGTNGEKGII
jgi:hypothetical protein